MGYDYLITLIKVIVGLITPQRMMYLALIAIGIFLLWVVCSLICSFQRKFYTNSVKLYSLLKNKSNIADKADLVKKYSKKISVGFAQGWKRFSSVSSGKPSDYISRYDALDSEISGGVLNQGKSLMKSFIWLFTTILLVLNLAYHGGENAITFSLIVECSVLPILFFCVLKIFYYLYTIVRHQFYKLDIEIFYDLIDVLDDIFEKKQFEPKQKVAEPFSAVKEEISKTEDTKSLNNFDNLENLKQESYFEEDQFNKNSSEDEIDNQNDVEAENESKQTLQDNNELYAEEEQDVLDKYDVFKKKNIDVSSLNEVPSTSKILPFINVDSDYVIKDDEDPSLSKIVSDTDNGSTVLGVIQDMNSVKKAQESEGEKEDEPSQEDIEEELEEKTENNESDLTEEVKKETIESDLEQSNKQEENDDFEQLEQPKENDIFDEEDEEIENSGFNFFEELDNYEAEKDEEISQQEESEELQDSQNGLETEEQIEETEESKTKILPEKEEIKPVEPETQNKKEFIVQEESEAEKLANIVGDFKSKKSKLSNGGVVIEHNAPITRRNSRSSTLKEFMLDSNESYANGFNPANSTPYNASYLSGQPAFVDQKDFIQSQYGYNNFSQNLDVPSNFVQAQQNYNAFKDPESFEFVNETPKQKVSQPKPKVQRSEPKSKSEGAKKVSQNKTKEKDVMTQENDLSKKRGRPKKQVFDDEVTINSEKEFNEVLARAEKLMRKSEEGLSASQSKRIEKELKMLMDAMNKYKESR